MTDQFKNLLVHLAKSSTELIKMSLFLEHPWIIVNEEIQDKIIYIFRRKKNELILSINGIVEKGRWEFLKKLNLLLIEKDIGTILYKQCFIDHMLLILKKDGSNEYLVLVNEKAKNLFDIYSLFIYLATKHLSYLPQKRMLSPSEQKSIAYNTEAINATKKRNYKQALNLVNTSIKLDNHNFNSYFTRGYVYYNLGENAKAIADYSIVLNLNPYLAKSYYNRALAYMEIKDMNRACEDWKIAFKLGHQNSKNLLLKYCNCNK